MSEDYELTMRWLEKRLLLLLLLSWLPDSWAKRSAHSRSSTLPPGSPRHRID
jgi:hypothetical protein